MKTNLIIHQSQLVTLYSFLFITLVMQFSMKGFAQYPDWMMHTAGNHVCCIAREADTIWIGTWGGVVAVDRVTGTLNTYNHSNSPLPYQLIDAIAIDANGNKWFGTHMKGLVKFDGSNWTNYTVSNSGISTNNVASIAIDNNGTKWLGMLGGGGLVKFDGTNWVVYKTSNSGIGSNTLRDVFIDSNGIIWLATDAGITVFDGTNWTVYNTGNSGLPSNNVKCITEDQAGNKWISLAWNGVVKFTGNAWISYNHNNSGLPIGGITEITIDANDNKWFGTEISGLVKFDDVNWTIYDTSNSEIFSNEVRLTLVDENGVMWVGMGTTDQGICTDENGGLQKFDGTTWIKYNTANSGLPDDIVNYITVENNEVKWVGTDQGLTKINGNIWTTYNTTNSGLPSNQVTTIASENNGNKWFCMPSHGLGVFDDSNWTFYSTSTSGLPSNYIKCIAFGPTGKKWLGTDIGLVGFDGTNWTVFNTSNSGLPNNNVTGLDVDNSGKIWIGTYGGGIATYDGTTWNVFNTSNSGLPSNSIITLTFDINGNLWAAPVTSGIVKYNGNNWIQYNSSNSGLPNNWVSDIAVDSSNNLWICSSTGWNGGLTKFDGTNWTTYGTSNSGVPDDPGNIAIDGSGNIWLADWGGLTQFNEGGFNTIVISNATFSNVTCYGTNNGTITIIASGGYGTLQYSIDDGATWYVNGGVFTGLSPNAYYARVKDSMNYEVSYTNNPIILTQPLEINISNVTSTNIFCNSSNDGTIVIVASGGTGSLLYSIISGYWQNNGGIFTDLPAGYYYIQVMDSLGCITYYSNNPVILTEPSAVIINEVTKTDVTIQGGNDGTITVFAVGGIAPLQYSINNGTTWQDTGTFTGLSAGEYFVVVKDANDCIVDYPQNPVTIEEPLVGMEVISPGFTFTLYPNPFSYNTTFSFRIGTSSFVTLDIYDCTGNKTCNVISMELPAGDYWFPFDGTGLKSGVHYYQIKCCDTIKTGKMVVL